MHKKLFVLFCVFLLAAIMIVPVFAAEPRVRGNVLYAGMQFDYIDNGSSITPWPANQFVTGSSFQEVDGFIINGAGDQLDVEFYLGTTNLTFFTSNYLLSSDLVAKFDSPYENVYFTSIEITGQLVTWERDSINRRYYAALTPFSISSSFEGTSEIDFGRMLRLEFSNRFARGNVYLSDLQIRISFRSDTDEPAIIGFKTNLVASDPTFSSWVNTQNTAYNISYEDGSNMNFDWILNMGNSFLDFKIAPDLTFNSVFKIILVVAIFFWVLTLTI